MNRKFTKALMIVALVSGMKATAQETNESPLDTLTRRVGAIQSTLDVLNRIKISGYIQPQFQVADSAGILSYAGGDFVTKDATGTINGTTDKRFMLRRGRVKIQYDAPNNDKGWSTSSYVFQIDFSEKGGTLKDLYAKFTDPWIGWLSVTAGMQNRPFGYEIGYSSGLRESPERGRMSQIIFPNERDLGAMITIQGPKTSNWNWIKLEAGMFNGTGGPSAGANTSDFDKYKDFIAHISVNRSTVSEKIKWGIGASIYDGGFRVDTFNVYKLAKDSAGINGYTVETKKSDVNPNISDRSPAKRQYVSADAQVSIDWIAGITTIRGEYIQGKQPGTGSSTPSATASPASPVTRDIYIRNFNGAYFYFLQNILQTPFQAIVKYDWYDPNRDVNGDEIGSTKQSTFKKTNGADIKYTTLGLGLAYRWDANVKITAYYDMVTNETSKNAAGFTTDLKDNVFTLRTQVKF